MSQLDDLNNQLLGLQSDITSKFAPVQVAAQSGNLLSYPYLDQVNLFNPLIGAYALPDKLNQYSSRIAVLDIPVAILTLQIVALILFFVSLVVTLLVERQADAMAVLRSRGASGSQAFGAMVMQGAGLCLVALVAGPLLAVFFAPLIAQRALPAPSQEAIHLVTGNPAHALLAVAWYAGGAVLVAFMAIIFLLRGQSASDVLAVRREAARSTKRPIWQRLRLDAVATVIAFTGYGLSLYISSYGGLLDAGTRTLVAAPLALIAPIFLLIGGTLLFLRLFPSILRLASSLSGRNRGAISMLAFAQMARSPRQTMRMTLLLAFATAFAIFTLIFSASQYQHDLDVAAFETGADFSGDIAVTSLTSAPNQLSIAAATATYRSIAGVTSATAGFSADGGASGASPDAPLIPLHLMAVDSSTFAHTAIWTAQDSSQLLTPLMQLLLDQRGKGLAMSAVPVIADEATVNALNAHTGSLFTVQVNGLSTNVDCVVVAIVQHIPTVNNNTDGGNVGNDAPPGGLLMDYTSFAAIYIQNVNTALGPGNDAYLPVNHVWLRTSDDPAVLAQVRAALQTPGLALANLYDRRALAANLSADPLTLDLTIILLIGAATALLFALVGDLLASWLSVRARLTSFAVLRALGAAPLQIARVLLWEQAAVYATALLLGVIFGALLAATVVPTLVFTGVPASGVLSDVSSGQFYIIQHVLPTTVVVPISLAAVFITLVLICVIALALMARVVLRPSMSQALRLNED